MVSTLCEKMIKNSIKLSHYDLTEEDIFINILNSIEAVVCVKDVLGNHIFVNDCYLSTVGVKLHDVIGKNDNEIFRCFPETAKAIIEIDEHVKRTKVKKIFQESVPTANGEIRHFKTAKTPLVINDMVIGVVCLAVDITERVNAETRLKEISLLKAHILSKMTHEIRTPLNAIIGFSDLILNNDKNKLEAKNDTLSLLKHINLASKHLVDVVNDVLDMSKIDANKIEIEMKSFNIEQLVKDTTIINQSLADEKEITLKHSLQGFKNSFRVGDSTKLSQILVNLVNNALKFTKKGGEVLLRVKAYSNGNVVRFTVVDNGIGIAKENQNKIFNIFTQENNSISREFGGTGLGLSISSGLVKSLGGHLKVKSLESVGSIFSFKIGLDVDQNVKKKHPIHIDRKSLTCLINKRCLLVEDFPLNQKVASMYLEQVGIIVDYAHNGIEALAKLNENQYDVVLMDIQMPIMDGLEATRIYRENNNDDIIIALTANVTTENVNKCYDVGCNDFISKPFDKDLLFKTLIKWLSL
ncbi:response regulator [Vibrio sp. YMD68]|uniref:response regulator n=1 Tax=Vibrio sp. YMD68 TaxID=3042300 RepID=UPI00249C706D|nr:response regulator [Vibrio sp. YMD68]WGW01380.1 response regulator [Vibrio sp. YMD68]